MVPAIDPPRVGPGNQSARWPIAAALIGGAMAAAGCSVEINPGDIEVVPVGVEPFHELVVAGGFDVEIRISDNTAVTVEVPDQIRDELRVDQSGDQLTIGFEDGLTDISPRPTATITTPSLERLEIGDASAVEIDGLSEDQLQLKVSEASTLTGQGRVGTLVIEVGGASNIDFDEVDIDRAQIEVSGASNVELPKAESIEGSVTGSSNVDVGTGVDLAVEVSDDSNVD